MLFAFARPLVNQIIKNIVDFNSMHYKQKREAVLRFTREHTAFSIIVATSVVLISGCIFLPQQGRVIAMDPEMRDAINLLSSTPTGKMLIKKAARSTNGVPIFLVSGSTTENSLKDPKGNTVLGLTRACFKSICSQYSPTGVFIYSNKDVCNSRADIIALTLAFEFENVLYAMHYPAMEYAPDSPEAQKSLEKVAMELGLIDAL